MFSPSTGCETLLDLSPSRLTELFANWGEPRFRARQVAEWIHAKGVVEPAQMTNLPNSLRQRLAAEFPVPSLSLAEYQKSADGSIKYLYLTPAGNPVETVLMPGFNYGTALCVSSQSGCSYRCGFCLTGRMGLREQLSHGAILAQLYLTEQHSEIPVDRIVFMGMGEPLANLQAVSNAVDVLVDPQLRGWSPRRITVSTIGLTGRIYEAAGRWPKVGLALSLHFTTTALRQKHMPAAEAEVTLLADALACYRQDNGGKITIEYSLLAGLNDGVEDLERLAAIARLEGTGASARGEDSTGSRLQSLPLPVNLIEYNPAPALGSYRPSPVRVLESFAAGLSNAGVPVTVRHSRGADIAAACGMLGAESGPQCGKAGGG